VQVAARGETAELQQSILIKGGGWEHVQTLQRTDPPVHGRYRGVAISETILQYQ
jgi:hypothetical protein